MPHMLRGNFRRMARLLKSNRYLSDRRFQKFDQFERDLGMSARGYSFATARRGLSAKHQSFDGEMEPWMIGEKYQRETRSIGDRLRDLRRRLKKSRLDIGYRCL